MHRLIYRRGTDRKVYVSSYDSDPENAEVHLASLARVPLGGSGSSADSVVLEHIQKLEHI